MDGYYFLSFFSPEGNPCVFWGKVQCTTSLHGFELCWPTFLPRGSMWFRPGKQGKWYWIPELCRERWHGWSLGTGELRGWEQAAVGSHSARSTGKAVCEGGWLGAGTAQWWTEGDYMLPGLRHDRSQFYPETSCKLLIPRFPITWNCKILTKTLSCWTSLNFVFYLLYGIHSFMIKIHDITCFKAHWNLQFFW